mmetsp:Transcript_1880/g.5497  ORF Transcript_1880/g.5497 Transcript_1880/m.5497 type:complete len:229 (+) Transcript_1880:305-991(+)|eukprot:CAMPEP_0206137162 /NCGR_PEP_ID=MMETSP1473-20131121/2322_1 /ASSEMBLY_ACC=CAM_ASM_001109 /TAXON_ID=1461547 /ORGANISM="Stichococcus sp, Strain RCC1054" /LENGTH=228 /DNA_ID=CAMNT_0053530103 /DNA_START=233 /DNA_END=919 /DNA_ORIENTATION=-
MDSQAEGSVQEDNNTQQTDNGYEPPSELSGAHSLKQAYINEKAAPELLQYAQELVDSTQKGITEQEALLDEWEGDREKDLAAGIIRFELQRVRYILRGYLRTRLRKLEQYVMALLDDPQALTRLSSQEAAYAREFFRLFGRHMKSALLDHLPENFTSMAKQSSASPDKDMVDRPDLEAHVFCRVLDDVGEVATDDNAETSVYFRKGDQYVVSYKWIRQLLADNSVILV